MKTTRRKQKINKKRLSILALIVLAFASVGFILLYNQLFQLNGTKNETTPTPTLTKDKVIDGKPANQDANPTPSAGSITIAVSTIGQDTAGGPLLIRTILDGADGGTCSIQASKAGVTKSYSTNVEFLGTYYSCNYNIPFSDLSMGQWTVTVQAQQAAKSGEVSSTAEIRS